MYGCLDLRFDVATKSAYFRQAFAHLYAPCLVAEDCSAAMNIGVATDGDKYTLAVDDSRVMMTGDADELFVAAAREIDVATVAATRHSSLLLHASAIATNDGVALITGPSGAGKSTSAAALTCAGYRYVGDEVVGILHDSIEAIANPKPLKLDGHARRALASNFPHARIGVDREPEVLVSAADLGVSVPARSTAPVMLVVEVAYRDGARTEARALSRADVAELLADQCFNFAPWGRRALDAVATIARSCVGVRIQIGDTAQSFEEIERLVA